MIYAEQWSEAAAALRRHADEMDVKAASAPLLPRGDDDVLRYRAALEWLADGHNTYSLNEVAERARVALGAAGGATPEDPK